MKFEEWRSSYEYAVSSTIKEMFTDWKAEREKLIEVVEYFLKYGSRYGLCAYSTWVNARAVLAELEGKK